MNIGDKVKYSGYVINPLRAAWCNAGTAGLKASRKQALDEACQLRGTVTEVYAHGLKVTLSTGGTAYSMPSNWVVCE